MAAMTAEEKLEETQMKEVEDLKVGEGGGVKVELEGEGKDEEEGEKKVEYSEEEVKDEEVLKINGSSPPKKMVVEKNGSFREESNFVSDLKEHERKALGELRAKLEEAILEDKLLVKEEVKVVEKKEVEKAEEEGEKAKVVEEEKREVDGGEEKVDAFVGCEKEANPQVEKVEASNFGADVSIWGVPLLPSKGCESTDVILLKFLRAREFEVNEAYQMLQNTLLWRKKFNINSLLEEAFSNDLNSVAYMDGVDREGHPVCYNVHGVFANEELYQKVFGNEEKREQFLRWRVQVMEKGTQELDFKPGGVSSLLQINDLKNMPGLSKKELRFATKEVVDLLQDNYPEFVARNVRTISKICQLITS